MRVKNRAAAVEIPLKVLIASTPANPHDMRHTLVLQGQCASPASCAVTRSQFARHAIGRSAAVEFGSRYSAILGRHPGPLLGETGGHIFWTVSAQKFSPIFSLQFLLNGPPGSDAPAFGGDHS